jgi:uncharacterized protein
MPMPAYMRFVGIDVTGAPGRLEPSGATHDGHPADAKIGRRRQPDPGTATDAEHMPDPSDDLRIVDNPEKHRYDAVLGETVVGFAEYRRAAGRLILVHTEVDPAFEGRGFGARLAAGVLTDLRTRGLRATVHCPFIKSYIQRHHEFDDVVIDRSAG